MSKDAVKTISVNKLWEELKVDRRTVKTILQEAGLEPVKEGNTLLYPRAEAIKAVENYKELRGDESESNRLKRLQADEQERLNRIAEKVESETYMEAELVKEIFSILCNSLEQVPGKAKSEMGLSHAQKERLQQLWDEARQNAAEKILKLA